MKWDRVRSPRIVCIVIAMMLSAGCVSHQEQVRTELFFGLTRPVGPDITETEFQQFLETEVTPRFPQGYTVLSAQGYWREHQGRARIEPTRVLILIHPSRRDANLSIEEIRSAYKVRFAQEAVLRTDETEKVSF